MANNPTVTITSDINALRAGETATIIFTFSPAPVGLTIGAISVTGGSLSGLAPTAHSNIFTALFTPDAGVNSGAASIDGGRQLYRHLKPSRRWGYGVADLRHPSADGHHRQQRQRPENRRDGDDHLHFQRRPWQQLHGG
ncbi:Ig-like domain-containing protein [Caulobacter segnis]|uniref:Ig-like domain-containing protein n=1 Tax=Caulobacter segnis TaxID=88688 RepID=UPI00240F629B|nr:Ig-like domain-containing protein [Caulobacter segnis]MDG2523326.1 Ig-like domain-containing protein [Caulobacter segnis]